MTGSSMKRKSGKQRPADGHCFPDSTICSGDLSEHDLVDLGDAVHQFHADNIDSLCATGNADLLLTFVPADELALHVVEFHGDDSLAAPCRKDPAADADVDKLLGRFERGIVDAGNLALCQPLEEQRNGDVALTAVELGCRHADLHLVLAGLYCAEDDDAVVYYIARTPVAERLPY